MTTERRRADSPPPFRVPYRVWYLRHEPEYAAPCRVLREHLRRGGAGAVYDDVYGWEARVVLVGDGLAIDERRRPTGTGVATPEGS